MDTRGVLERPDTARGEHSLLLKELKGVGFFLDMGNQQL